MIGKYNIPHTINLDNHSCFNDPNTYEDFQGDLIKFQNKLTDLVNNRGAATFYKFGDGDYRFLKGIAEGSAMPGKRALSKPYSEINLELHNTNAQKCDYYTCEIYPENRKEFNEVIKREIDYPAEFGYGLVGNKWLTKTFKGKIGVIGAQPKLELIQQLLEYPEYKEYLGIDKFEDYIHFPQKFAADDIEALENILKPQLENSTAGIFLLGIGHAKSGILHKFTEYKKAIYLDVGGGIDMLAGCINTKRPYAGGWVNYKLKNFNYSTIDYMNYNNKNEKYI
tara:strand:- start:1735 stop:2577 length:843 start_codon:yes stop_codon:yes gene_type:complete